MAFLTDEKLVIVGAGGMIGSNMVQSVFLMSVKCSWRTSPFPPRKMVKSC